MSAREYRLGRRQAGAERTRAAVLLAASQVVAELGADAGLGEVARRAGVSRITIYNRFGSKSGLLEALAEAGRPMAAAATPVGADPVDDLRRRIAEACAVWAADPALYRQLQARVPYLAEATDLDRKLAERLAAHDRLRPGCSIKEAEDVIGILTSFPVFDRLHKGGRRSPAAVAEILVRMASAFMGEHSTV